MIDPQTGWEQLSLADCLAPLDDKRKKVERGWSPQCLNHPVTTSATWGVLKTTAIQMGEFQPIHNKELPDNLEPRQKLEVQNGDFLMTTTGPRTRCGVICLVESTPPKLIFSGKILRFRANTNIVNPNFLMYMLMSPSIQNELDELKVGTSDSSVSIGNEQVLGLKILLPPLRVQEDIVGKLKTQLSSLDNVVRIARKCQDDTRKLADATIHKLMNSDSSSQTVPLKDVITLQRGFDLPVQSRRGGTVPIFSSNGLLAMHDEAKVTAPGVVTGRSGTIGKVFYVEQPFWALNTALFVKDFKGNHPRFIYYLLQTIDLVRYAGGSTVPSLDRKLLNDIPVTLPSLQSQISIANTLDELISKINGLPSAIAMVEKEQSELRRSLLHAAFSGQLTIKDSHA